MKVSRVFSIGAFILALTVLGCTEIEEFPDPNSGFTISKGKISLNGSEVYYYGANAMQTFGLGNADLMDDWNLEITREFIGNFREQPLSGGAIQASDEVWYHSLQQIVDLNRVHDRVTILCPFGWVDENGQQTLLTGLNPSQQPFYEAYKKRLSALADHFKEQPDVWIEVWNEPYHWNNENGYTHELWLADMSELTEVVRSVSQNIVVVPGNEQGQSEDALLSYGEWITEEYENIIFDLHAYEKWMIDVSSEKINERLDQIQAHELALLFGEIGVINSSGLMDVSAFLETAKQRRVSLLGWLWVTSDSYQNALLDSQGSPNNHNNLNWGSTFKSVLYDKTPN